MKNRFLNINGNQLITIALIISLTTIGLTYLIVTNEGELNLCIKPDACLYIGNVFKESENK